MALTIKSTLKRNRRPGITQGFVTDHEARQAARIAGLDYKLSATPKNYVTHTGRPMPKPARKT